jgi:hypothetical protein
MIQEENEEWFQTNENMSNITGVSAAKVYMNPYSDCHQRSYNYSVEAGYSNAKKK